MKRILQLYFLFLFFTHPVYVSARDYVYDGQNFTLGSVDSTGGWIGDVLRGGFKTLSLDGDAASTPTPGGGLSKCAGDQPLCNYLIYHKSGESALRYGYADSYFYELGTQHLYYGDTYYKTDAVASKDGEEIKIQLLHSINNVRGNCYLLNTTSNRYWNCRDKNHIDVYVNKGIVSGGTKSLDISSANPCGWNALCGYEYTAWITSAEISLGIIIPETLAAGTYYFNDVSIAKMVSGLSSAGPNAEQAKLESFIKVSGSITVPDRCYIKINNGEKNPGLVSIEFTEVDSSAREGFLEKKELILSGACYGLGNDKSLSMSLKATPLSQTINDYTLRLKPANLSNEDGFLGVMIKDIDDNSCNGNDNSLMFGVYKDFLKSNGNVNFIFNKPLYFNLCRYGSTLLTSGQHSGALTLTTRWRLQ
ncbi:hypothetical protein [Escherichia coli]|uniref:hypothetical protein n=1 Tax=Escherichia coli TaxID=562 RepID=UPI000B7E4ED4|nr:hypothetical protein [Escherichia coli]